MTLSWSLSGSFSYLPFTRKFKRWFVLNNTCCKAKQSCKSVIFYITVLMVKDFSAIYIHTYKRNVKTLSVPLTINLTQLTDEITLLNLTSECSQQDVLLVHLNQGVWSDQKERKWYINGKKLCTSWIRNPARNYGYSFGWKFAIVHKKKTTGTIKTLSNVLATVF